MSWYDIGLIAAGGLGGFVAAVVIAVAAAKRAFNEAVGRGLHW